MRRRKATMGESKKEMTDVSLRNFALSPSLQSLIGEKFSMNNRIVVVEDTSTEIKVVVTEKSLHWLADLWKVLPKEKKLTIVMGDEIEVEKVFIRGYNPYGETNYR
jgi:DNA-binding transcriptional regulator WhiA